MDMKSFKTTFFTVFFIFCLTTVFAQSESKEIGKRFGIGMNINQIQRDFGIGVHVISPYIAKRVAFRLGGNLQWFEHINTIGSETEWTPYFNFQAGVRGRQFVIEDKLSIYGEGGLILLMPSSDFTTSGNSLGGYGLFGFEFYPSPVFGYFIELGGVGTGATADKIPGKPIYSNGFITNVGFRINI